MNNCVPTIGAVCGKACALAQVAVESSLCQARVCESSFISSNTLLLFRHKFPLGATPRSVNGTGSSRGFQHQANAPHLGRGANLRKIKEKIQVLDRTKVLYDPQTQAYGETNYLKEEIQVLDRTKVLYGPRTQAYGETNYLKEKIQVLDRTRALYGPRTQAYGETNYLKEKVQVLDRTKALYGPRTQVYGETNYLKEKVQVLDRTKALYGPRTQAYGETNYLKEKTSLCSTHYQGQDTLLMLYTPS